MEFPAIMQALGANLSLADLQVNDEGACAIRFDDLIVSFHLDSDGAAFTASTVLGTVDPEDSAIMEKLLTASLYGDGSGESTFGVDDIGKAWLLRRFTCTDLTIERFMQDLESFVNHAENWQERLRDEDAKWAAVDGNTPAKGTSDYMRA